MKEMLNRIFEYRDGMLFWRNRRTNGVKAGERAGTQKPDGYRNIGLKGKMYKEHRIIWMMFHGETNQFIDHIDCNPANSRIENLRLATRAQNSYNRHKYSNNTSGFKGVSYFKAGRNWHARIRCGEKQTHLGYFPTPELAHQAYQIAAKKLHGEYAKF